MNKAVQIPSDVQAAIRLSLIPPFLRQSYEEGLRWVEESTNNFFASVEVEKASVFSEKMAQSSVNLGGIFEAAGIKTPEAQNEASACIRPAQNVGQAFNPVKGLS